MRTKTLLAILGLAALAAMVMAASLPSGQKLVGEATGRALDLNANPSALTKSDGSTPVATWDDDSFDVFFPLTATTVNGSLTSNWDAAYSDRMKWDGGATGLVPATGRTSLGLGSAATRAAEDTLTNGSNLPSGQAVTSYVNGLGFITDPNDSVSGSELDGVFSTNGILVRTGAATYVTTTNNSTNWNTAYTDRLKWDGGATGLNAATGRTSLGLGSSALRAAEDTLTNGENLPDGAAIIGYYGSPVSIARGGLGLSAIGSANQLLGVNAGASGLEYKTLSASGGITITHGANSIALSASGLTGNHNLLDGSAHPDTLAGAVAAGDIVIGNATPKWGRLAGNATTARQFLMSQGTGSAATPAQWAAPTKVDVGLASVENTALSTWAGSANLNTLAATTTVGVVDTTQGTLKVAGDASTNGGRLSLESGHSSDGYCNSWDLQALGYGGLSLGWGGSSPNPDMFTFSPDGSNTIVSDADFRLKNGSNKIIIFSGTNFYSNDVQSFTMAQLHSDAGYSGVSSGPFVVGSTSSPVYAYNTGDIEARDDILAWDDLGARGDLYVKGQVHIGDLDDGATFPTLLSSNGPRNYLDSASVTTANATPTTIYSCPVNVFANGALTIEATVVGSQASAANNAFYKKIANFNCVSGAVTRLGSPINLLGTDQESDSAWNMDIVASGTNAVVQVTGKASTNIRWTVSVHVTQTQSY